MKAAVGVALFLAAGSAGAQMYKCAAPNGRITFSDRPCAEAGVKAAVPANGQTRQPAEAFVFRRQLKSTEERQGTEVSPLESLGIDVDRD